MILCVTFLKKKKNPRVRCSICLFFNYRDHHKKQNTLAALQKKALDKNPDEFYHKMINSKLEVKINTFHMCGSYFNSVFCGFWQDGVHTMTKANEAAEMTEEQKKVMRTQDIKYVEMKRVAEAKVR